MDRMARVWRVLRPGADLRRSLDTNTRATEALRDSLRQLQTTVGRLERECTRIRAVAEGDLELDPHQERLAALMADPGVSRHVQQRVAETAVVDDPCPHVVIDDCLHRELYDALIRGLPPVALFEDAQPNKRDTKVPPRFAPRYVISVWNYLIDVVLARDVVPALVERFRPALNDWLRSSFSIEGDDPLSTVPIVVSNPRLSLRTRGYVIAPHRDPKWGFLTMIFYLARDGDKDAWGTQLYRVAEDAESQGTQPDWIEPGRCTLVKDVSFVPNRMLVFLNSTGAHGATIGEDESPGVERYCLQLRIGPRADQRERLRGLLSGDRQPLWTGRPALY